MGQGFTGVQVLASLLRLQEKHTQDVTMTPEKPAFQRISPAQAAAMIRSAEPPSVFDVRDLPSYQQGHVDIAAHLTEQRVLLWLNRLPKDKPVLIYCYKGNASQTYAQMFIDFRFAEVYSVDGGYAPLAEALAGELQTG
jgi:rhodanese-related sulfurtransferase